MNKVKIWDWKTSPGACLREGHSSWYFITGAYCEDRWRQFGGHERWWVSFAAGYQWNESEQQAIGIRLCIEKTNIITVRNKDEWWLGECSQFASLFLWFDFYLISFLDITYLFYFEIIVLLCPLVLWVEVIFLLASDNVFIVFTVFFSPFVRYLGQRFCDLLDSRLYLEV